MSAVAKRQARRSNADELTVGDDFGGLDGGLLLVFRHPQVIVAKSIKLEGLLVDLVVKVHAACGNLDDNAFWDGLAVGQGEWLEDLALERAWVSLARMITR